MVVNEELNIKLNGGFKMTKYQCFESNCNGIYTESELLQMWNNQIDKSNFENFDCWIEEMLEMMILRIV